MQVRGKWIILFIFGLSIAAATFAVWFQRQKTYRALEFYGGDNARLIKSSRDVELMELGLAVANPQSAETVTIGGETLPVKQTWPVAAAPGFTHLRQALIENSRYRWDQSRGDCASQWDYVVRFRSDDRSLLLAFDLDCRRLLQVGPEKEVALADFFVEGLITFLEDYRHRPEKS